MSLCTVLNNPVLGVRIDAHYLVPGLGHDGYLDIPSSFFQKKNYLTLKKTCPL